MKNNMVSWFEGPLTNMERAIAFYEKVFELKLDRHPMGELDMDWFSWSEEGAGSPGTLIHYPAAYKPSLDGVLVYFIAHSGYLPTNFRGLNRPAARFCEGKHKFRKTTDLWLYLSTPKETGWCYN